jgi:hypothetical protein
MKFFLGFFLLLATFSGVKASDVTDYMLEFAKTKISNYSREQNIINNNDFETLIKILTPFYKDTISNVRQKAYYLVFKKTSRSSEHHASAINILLSGCNDNDGAVVGQNLEFLKTFSLNDFDEKSLEQIKQKLANHRVPHYKDFVLLAGFVGTGKDILFQKLLDQGVSDKIKWYVSLALARMGNADQISSCMNKVRKLPVNDDLLDYVIPDLIYMRQKEALDFCIEILNKDEKLCHSLNPDSYESVVCSYRVLEMIAPVIVNIPVSLDATGNLKSNNYENTLNEARQWILNNKQFEIKKDIF